jgi:hypothetical protein
MVSIATLGMFNPAGGGVGGGGAPAMIQEEIPRPTLMVTSVHYSKKKKDDKDPIQIIIKDVT